MNHEEIDSAVNEVCSIVQRDPSKIDFADVNKQFQRLEKAGLAINRAPTLRGMRDRVYDRIERLKQWPMTDSAERAEFVRESIPYIRAITVEAHVMDNPEE
jgi:hypothetical protein